MEEAFFSCDVFVYDNNFSYRKGARLKNTFPHLTYTFSFPQLCWEQEFLTVAVKELPLDICKRATRKNTRRDTKGLSLHSHESSLFSCSTSFSFLSVVSCYSRLSLPITSSLPGDSLSLFLYPYMFSSSPPLPFFRTKQDVGQDYQITTTLFSFSRHI